MFSRNFYRDYSFHLPEEILEIIFAFCLSSSDLQNRKIFKYETPWEPVSALPSTNAMSLMLVCKAWSNVLERLWCNLTCKQGGSVMFGFSSDSPSKESFLLLKKSTFRSCTNVFSQESTFQNIEFSHDFPGDILASYAKKIEIDDKSLVSVSLIYPEHLVGSLLISSHYLKHLTLEYSPYDPRQNSAIIECPNLISLTSKYFGLLFISTPSLENLDFFGTTSTREIRTKTSLPKIRNFAFWFENYFGSKQDFSSIFNLFQNMENLESVSLDIQNLSENHIHPLHFEKNKRLRKIKILDSSSLQNLSLSGMNLLEHLHLQCPVLRALDIETCSPIKNISLENFHFLDSALLASILYNTRNSLEQLTLLKCSPFTNISLKAFPRLQKLTLIQCNKLKTVSISGSSALEKFQVFKCIELNAIDFGSSLSSIQELSILEWNLPFDSIEAQISKMTKLRYLYLENVESSQLLALSNENLRALKLSLGVFKLIPLDLPR